MPTTTDHSIYYPSGSAVPNVPVQMQTQSESIEAALNEITKAPMILLEKSNAQLNTGSWMDVTWNVEVHKQGITHAVNSASIVVPESGIYQVNVRVAFQSTSATGAMIVNINGVDKSTTRTDETADATAYAKPHCVTYLKLNKGDILKIRSQSANGVNLQSSESFCQIAKLVTY